MHTRRFGRLTGATAQRLLDGGDGPPPLPQLVAAVTAPATAAELCGEATARAAFRSSTHAAPLSSDIPRRAPVRVTSSVVIAKVITAIALTASTAGGIALATRSTPTDPYVRAISETTAAADTAPSLVITSPTSTGGLSDPENRDGSDGPAGAPAADGALRTMPSTSTSPKAPHPTGRCSALTNLSDDQAGKATKSPAFTDLSCSEAGTAAGPTRPTGRPDGPPGKPAGNANANGNSNGNGNGNAKANGNANANVGPKAAESEAERSEKVGKTEEASDAQAGRDVAGTADRGKSGEHRQDG